MTPQIIVPKDQQHWLELRTHDLTSTDIAALFGISPYCTPYELWHRKKDLINVEFIENQRMKWGTRLQDAIAAGIAEEKGWTIRRKDEYIRLPELRLGSSFDFEMIYPPGTVIDNGPCGLLEIKNVDSLQYKREWIEDEKGIQAPYHIEIQVQHQLLVSCLQFSYLGALVGGNDLKLFKRTRDEKIISAITAKAWSFWQSIEDNKPPAPDFEADADFIAKQYNFAEPGKIVDLTEDIHSVDLVSEYRSLKDIISVNTKRCEGIKAELLTRIGDAEKAIHPTFSISAGLVGPTWIEAFERKGYRNFRINAKKEK